MQNNNIQLAIITAIESCRASIIQLLKNASVNTFTIYEAVGYKDNSTEDVNNNWFGSEYYEIPSVVFNIFATEETVQTIKKSVNSLNEASEYESKIHFVICPIADSNYEK